MKDKAALMLLTKNNKFKLCPNNEDIDSKTGLKIAEIEESIKNIRFSHIEKKYIKELIPDISNDENFNRYEFYMIQIKHIRRYSGTEPMNINDKDYNKCLIIKIPDHSKLPLDLIISYLDLTKNANERKNSKSENHEKKDKSDSTKNIPKITIKEAFSSNLKDVK